MVRPSTTRANFSKHKIKYGQKKTACPPGGMVLREQKQETNGPSPPFYFRAAVLSFTEPSVNLESAIARQTRTAVPVTLATTK